MKNWPPFHWPAATGIAAAFVLLGLAYYTAQQMISSRPAALPVIQPARYLIGAHYYIWYPDNFREGYLRGHLRPRQTFYGGEYQSTDTQVIARHLAWCSEYGIDFLSIGWWSSEPERTESFLDNLYQTPNIADIKFCVFYEDPVAWFRLGARNHPLRRGQNDPDDRRLREDCSALFQPSVLSAPPGAAGRFSLT